MNPSPQVENLPVPGAPVEDRKAAALEGQAVALARSAAAVEAMAGISKRERYLAILNACIIGRVATDVNGFLRFADELNDGVNARFPEAAQ